MAELNAQTAREFVNESAVLGTERWYGRMKDELFQTILDLSLEGKSSFILEGDIWNENETRKDFLKNKLIGLGYEVTFQKYGEFKEGMFISW